MDKSIYFKNSNTECTNKYVKYIDCKGDEHCDKEYGDPIYIQEREILPPVFLDYSLSNSIYNRAKITHKAYRENGNTYIHCKEPLKVGSIFKVISKTNYKYYIKGVNKSKINNNFVYKIKRVDNYPLVSIDLGNLSKNSIIIIKGFFGNNK